MDILHISDLHISAKNKRLQTFETGLGRLLRNRFFDFIIVSGDLTDSAETADYNILVDFSERFLLQHLRKQELPRIILVPGNHDVDWTSNIATLVSVNELTKGRSLHELEQELFTNNTTLIRRHLGKAGVSDFYSIDSDKYPLRFSNVQSFLDRFYKDSLATPHQKFKLTSSAGGDWSAHVFREEKVVFCGFNSCYRNDRFLRSAAINPTAMHEADMYLASIGADNYLRIAVWHHGVRPERMRDDSLSLSDLGQLYNLGFRIGFHGHIHEADISQFDTLFKERFVAIAAGSLGAEDKPEAVSNQCSIVSLRSNVVHVSTFECAPGTGVWEATGSPRILLQQPSERDSLSLTASCAVHKRTYAVDDNGISRVTVALSDATINDKLPLAFLREPYCEAISEGNCIADGGVLLDVTRTIEDGEGVLFSVSPRQPGQHYKALTWHYLASNTLPLTRCETSFRDEFLPWLPNIPGGQSTRPHTVRIPCEELILRTEYTGDNKPHLTLNRRSACVERLVADGGRERWERVPSEQDRCTINGDENAVELRVRRPIIGYRYSLIAELAKNGTEHSIEARRITNDVRKLCLQESTSMPNAQAPSVSLAELLTRAVESQLNDILVAPLDIDSWVGSLWDFEAKRLIPTFGRFSNQLWSVRFSYGVGVAGHCFRFSSLASWFQDLSRHLRRESLIYQERPVGAPTNLSYEWIVCLPILIDPIKPSCIGVVSLETRVKNNGGAARQLRKLAQDEAERVGDALKPANTLKGPLVTAVNSSFWGALAEPNNGLAASERVIAKSVLDSFNIKV